MQPQDNYTGYRQQPAAGQGIPPVPDQAPLPPIEEAIPTIEHAAPDDHRGHVDSIEQWVSEVEKALSETRQNPFARARAVADIKVRYQRQVLGLQGHTKGD